MFLWWSSTKIVQAIMIPQKKQQHKTKQNKKQKNKVARGRDLFSLYIYIENFLWETTGWMSI